jgi:hypothetical protein
MKRILGITTLILFNSLTHAMPHPQPQQKQHNSYPHPRKKNYLEPSSHTREPEVETIHSNEVKKNAKN